jgi:hypothetical protein
MLVDGISIRDQVNDMFAGNRTTVLIHEKQSGCTGIDGCLIKIS